METGDVNVEDLSHVGGFAAEGGQFIRKSKKALKRLSLLLPGSEPQQQQPQQHHQRRASQLSTLSVTPSTGRRASLVSLLSVTPSMAARRFSFSIGGGAHLRVG